MTVSEFDPSSAPTVSTARRMPAIIKLFFVLDALVLLAALVTRGLESKIASDITDFFRLSRESNLPTAYGGVQDIAVGSFRVTTGMNRMITAPIDSLPISHLRPLWRRVGHNSNGHRADLGRTLRHAPLDVEAQS